MVVHLHNLFFSAHPGAAQIQVEQNVGTDHRRLDFQFLDDRFQPGQTLAGIDFHHRAQPGGLAPVQFDHDRAKFGLAPETLLEQQQV